MTWEKHVTTHDGIGTIVDVYLNKQDMLIKRIFKEGSITVSGQTHEYTQQQVKDFYHNEVYWLNKLDSKWLPELVKFDDTTQTITQRYYGPCLLDYLHTDLHTRIPNLADQIVEMHEFFKKHNVFKRNNSLSNLSYNNEWDQVIAFDFKWAKERPAGMEMELHSYQHWLNKIDKDLPARLKALI
jgi:hypothetical protein